MTFASAPFATRLIVTARGGVMFGKDGKRIREWVWDASKAPRDITTLRETVSETTVAHLLT